ncbi:hypothetical protein BW41_02421 [Sphingomonas sp. RIT328]|nr:hypothetical protein BW41_02421 [Sphingomonas sp. RIT328]
MAGAVTPRHAVVMTGMNPGRVRQYVPLTPVLRTEITL